MIFIMLQKSIVPCDEENPALWDILFSEIIEVINCISALVGRKASGEVLISFSWLTKLFHNNLLLLLFNLENYEAVCSLCFQLHKLQFAIIVHSHS